MKNLKRLPGRNYHTAYGTVLALVCVSLLIRLVTLPFSDEISQARKRAVSFFMSKLCIGIMESGSALISYGADDGHSPGDKRLFTGILEDKLLIHEYTDKRRNALKEFLKSTEEKQNQYNGEYLLDNNITIPTQESGISYQAYNIIDAGKLSREYILTNGAAFDEQSLAKLLTARAEAGMNKLEVGFSYGDLYLGEHEVYEEEAAAVEAAVIQSAIGNPFTPEQLKDINFLIRNFYIVDPATRVTESLFNGDVLVNKDMTIKQENDVPQILIYHTHSQEVYINSREGVKEDTVVGIGSYLAEILKTRYGYNVIHDNSCYDVVDGKTDRSKAYKYARESIMKILEENPTIEVVIDLHRDAGGKRSTLLNGKETAQVMLLNGLCRDVNGPITDLDNPNLQDNLAFSLQLQLKSLELYPGFFYRNYLQDYRYNLHVRPKSILMELGTESNTLASARNAMVYFAEILDSVLQGK